MTTTPYFRTLGAKIVELWDADCDIDVEINEMRKLLATPPPEPPPTNGPNNSDVTELFYRHMGEGSEVGFENAIAEVLTRWGHPATPPPEPPTDEELVTFLYVIDPGDELSPLAMARAALERWGHG